MGPVAWVLTLTGRNLQTREQRYSQIPELGNQLSFPTSVGSLAMLLVMRLASSTVSYGF
jgi:hypothetical protein